MSAIQPSRGEVWFLNLNPTEGREWAGSRPASILPCEDIRSAPISEFALNLQAQQVSGD